jgi:catechol 2,3-dioxygenase-like lactoylglutathione lyase family enzyme
MKIHRVDHIGIVVNDLAAAKAFFLDFGLEVEGSEAEMEGELLDRLIGLDHVKTEFVWLRPPGGQVALELIKFHTPPGETDTQQSLPNTPGIRHIAFAVEDIEAIVDKLKKKGVEVFSEIQTYEDTHKLCFCRGPEGIILDLSEKIK